MLRKVLIGFGTLASKGEPFMTITSSASKRISYLMKQKQDPLLVGVKISLTKKGCNGLTYAMNYITHNDIKRYDEIIEVAPDCKVIVDSKAIMALLGTEMSFIENDLGSQFVFKNPNEKGKCGCGESFHI